MRNLILETVIALDADIYKNMNEYSQFTIDFVENFRSDLEDADNPHGRMNDVDEQTFFEAMTYNLGNIIEICKDGEDKMLFERLLNRIEDVLKAADKLPEPESNLVEETLLKNLRAAGREDLIKIHYLNKSGFAGVDRKGNIVDRRENPEAVPVQENRLFNVAKPKKTDNEQH